MDRRNEPEDDGRIVADMSGLETAGLFGRRPRASKRERKNADGFGETGMEGGLETAGTGRNPWEDTSFSWQERVRYIVMALGAAFLIGAVLLGGLAVVIWLFTLYD